MTKNTVTKEQVEAIIEASRIMVQKVGEKTTLVFATLPSGFVIVETSSCVDPDNYSEEIGAGICMERIRNKVWELEGYRLQNEIAAKPLHFMARVYAEKEELDAKLHALEAFMKSDRFEKIEPDEAKRMSEQSSAMSRYSEILRQRISAYGSGPCCFG